MTDPIKAIAFYLPQFHEIPENNLWWGKGFTEWTNVVKAKPLFLNHYQPHQPAKDNYYDLLDERTFPWQIELAKKHGVYGFCFYHYWFKDGKKLLEKPVEHYLANRSLDLPFCLSWANEPWSRRWDGSENEILMHQEYGNTSDWEKHFEYLLPFFQDSRYIRHDGKPLVLIYKPNLIPKARDMIAFWRECALSAGFPGLTFGWQYPTYLHDKADLSDSFEFLIEFEPFYSLIRKRIESGMLYPIIELACDIALLQPIAILKIQHILSRLLASFVSPTISQRFSFPKVLNYSKVIRYCENMPIYNDKSVPGAFPSWDNTARRGASATMFLNSTPDKFRLSLRRKLLLNRSGYSNNFLFINAWNEWAEGAHLEPDNKYGDGFLRAISDALRQ